jgi:hypothetical protein
MIQGFAVGGCSEEAGCAGGLGKIQRTFLAAAGQQRGQQQPGQQQSGAK